MDFREELKAGADKCVEDQRRSIEHVVRQAFFAGVGWHIEYVRKKAAEPPTTPDVS